MMSLFYGMDIWYEYPCADHDECIYILFLASRVSLYRVEDLIQTSTYLEETAEKQMNQAADLLYPWRQG